MRKLICTFPLLLLATITLAARADSFTYEFVRKGSLFFPSSGFSTYLFTEPSILTVDTVIPIADITTTDVFLSAFEINPVSPGAVSWTDTGFTGSESSGVANFTGALTSTGTFLGIGSGPSFPFPSLTIAASPVPVPEPFSLLLLGTGTFGLLMTVPFIRKNTQRNSSRLGRRRSPHKGRIHSRRSVDQPFAFPLQSCGGPYIFGN